MTVKDVIKKLEKLPQDARLLAYHPDAGSFIGCNFLQLEDWKEGEFIVFYDEPPKKKR